MGCSQCFSSPGYVVGQSGAFGGASGVGYGYGSRSVPVPLPMNSQMLVASQAPVALVSPQVPITTVPLANAPIPTYGQTSVINAPYTPPIVQPGFGTIGAPVQPYGISSVSIVR